MSTNPRLVDAMMLSDLVLREHGTGKLSLINCFNAFTAPKFPFATPPFFVTVFLTNLGPETINATVRIEESASGHVLTSIAGEIKIREESGLTPDAIFEVPFRMPSFSVAAPGDYRMVLLLNSQPVATRPIRIVSVSSPPAA